MNGTDDLVNAAAAPATKKPLSLLILLNQSFSKEQKQLILHKLNSSLNQLNDPSLSASYIVNLQEELNYIIQANHHDQFSFDQEYRIASKNDNFEFELLVNGTLGSFKKALNAFLQSPTQIKSFIYAGIDHNATANLLLQDSLFSYDDFHLLVNDYLTSATGAADALKATTFNFNFNSKSIHENSSWKHLEKLFKNAKFLQPTTTVCEDGPSNDLTNHLRRFLNETPITDLLEETKLAGALNLERPALYIFPAREGDCAYFQFNGYSTLVNGGYDRANPCFWRFASMLKQIDSVMITHQDSDALGGLSSLFAKKVAQPNVRPNVLSVFGNLVKSRHSENDADVILNACDELKLRVQPLVKNSHAPVKPHQQPEHVNLYFKHGYGSLDMYVLSPFTNSAEYKEFLHHTQAKVHANVHKSHLNVNQTFKNIPVSHLCSAVVLLAWTPSKSNDNAVRILFTGNAPQHVVALALEKVKDFDLLQTPVYKTKEPQAPVAPVVKKPPKVVADKVDAAAAAAPAAGGDKVVVEKANGEKKAAKPNAEHAKGDRALNTSSSGPKPTPSVANGVAKPPPAVASGTSAPKPPSAPKQTNGVQKRESAAPVASNAEPKKSEAAKKPAADEHKEVKKSASASAAAPRPPVAKKEEAAKAKPEKVAESTRVSTAPVASKSEHNTKSTASTTAAAAAAPAKPRPSSAKPNVKPEKEKEEHVEKKEHKKPVAAPAKPAAQAKSSTTEPKGGKAAAVANGGGSKDAKVNNNVIKSYAAAAATKPVEQKVVEVVEQKLVEPEVAECCRVETRMEMAPLPVLLPVPILSCEQVEPVVAVCEQLDIEPVVAVCEQLKQLDIEPVVEEVAQNGVEEVQQNGHHHHHEEHHEEELVRKEVVLENKSEFVASECAPFERTNDDEQVEKAENYVNHNAEEDAELLNDDQDSEENHIASDDSPNLSPVKPSLSKDSISSEDDVVVDNDEHAGELVEEVAALERENEFPERVVVLQEAEVEDQGCRREHLELNFDGVTAEPVQPCVVSDPQEFIQTPNRSSDNSPVVETAPEDVMTRSFIDNGDGALTNPFNLPTNEDRTPSEETTSNEDSVHDYSGNLVEELKQAAEEPVEFDDLINGLKTMKIEQQQQQQQENESHTNGNHHENGHSEEVLGKKADLLLDFGSQEALAAAASKSEKQTPVEQQSTDPTTWNLLQLPKPVNPNEQSNGTATAAAPAPTTNGKSQATTPNAKRSGPASASSPTSSSTLVAKQDGAAKPAASKALNTSVSKSSAPASSNAAKPATAANAATKSPAIHPLYFEVSYIPAHGNQYYVDNEFFKRVRARFYVLSTIDPSQHVLNSLLEAKQVWEDKELQVSIVPTYESDTLRHWFMLNAEQLAKNKIDILPAANLTTLTIDNNTDFSYQVHKLEF